MNFREFVERNEAKENIIHHLRHLFTQRWSPKELDENDIKIWIDPTGKRIFYSYGDWAGKARDQIEELLENFPVEYEGGAECAPPGDYGPGWLQIV